MAHEEFKSELGNVAVTQDHIEREERESIEWEHIEGDFSSVELVDHIHFSEIDGLDFQPEPRLPQILMKVDGGWKRMFFRDEEVAENCFKTLRYNWRSFRQRFD